MHVTNGFDFLGCNVRLYASTRSTTGTKPLIKPSADAVKGIKDKLRKEWDKSVGKQPLNARIPVLKRSIRGWANYHRHVVAVKTCEQLDKWMFKREQRYTKRLHRGKPARWRKERHWGPFPMKIPVVRDVVVRRPPWG